MREEEKGKMGGEVYTPCWNVGKNSWLTSMDEKKEWADNILPPSAKIKFEIYKGEELGNRIDHAVYELNMFILDVKMIMLCKENKSTLI